MTQTQRLLGFLRPYSFRFVVAVVLMAIVGVCEAVTALLIGPVFDRVLNPKTAGALIELFPNPFSGNPIYLQDFMPDRVRHVWSVVAIAILAVTIAKGLSEYFATYFVNFIGHSVVRDLRNLLYTKIVRQSIGFFTSHPTGRLMSAITSDTEKIQNAVSQASADLLRHCFTLLGLLLVVFYMDWKLALGSMILSPFVVFPSANIGRDIRN